MKAKPGVNRNRSPPVRRRITRPRRYLCLTVRSSLAHFLFAFPAAHPLLAPLPAHLSALLPSPRRAFHRVAGAGVVSCVICSFRRRNEEADQEGRTARSPDRSSSVLRPTRCARHSSGRARGRSNLLSEPVYARSTIWGRGHPWSVCKI